MPLLKINFAACDRRSLQTVSLRGWIEIEVAIGSHLGVTLHLLLCLVNESPKPSHACKLNCATCLKNSIRSGELSKVTLTTKSLKICGGILPILAAEKCGHAGIFRKPHRTFSSLTIPC